MKNIMKQLEDIKYGWVDKSNNIYYGSNDLFSDNYILQSPEEVLKNKVGVCWDQVELERYLFEKENIEFNTYFITHYDNDKCPSHTFLIYKKDNKYYWFEHSWEIFKGIHEYNSEIDAIKDVKEKFIKYEVKLEVFNPMNLCIYKYNKPKYHIKPIEFYKHCEACENIKI